jgi:hypothetical protein
MAYFEASLVLIVLLQRSEIKRTSDAPLQPGETIVMPIAGGLKVTITPLPESDSLPAISTTGVASISASPASASAASGGCPNNGCPFSGGAKSRL